MQITQKLARLYINFAKIIQIFVKYLITLQEFAKIIQIFAKKVIKSFPLKKDLLQRTCEL